MYKSSGRILEGARVGYESNEAKVTIIANDVGAVGVPFPQRSLMNPVGERLPQGGERCISQSP